MNLAVKFFFFSFFFSFLTSQLSAQKDSIHFVKENIPDLLSRAKASEKLIFVNVTAVWCQPCKEMEVTTFQDSSIIAFFNENFINKKFDLDANYQDSISNLIKLESHAVPKFFFLDTGGNIILLDGGLKSATDFLQLGKRAKSNANLPSELAKLDSIYPRNKHSETFLIHYMNSRQQAGKSNGKILNDYLQLLPQETYLKENILTIIMENETDIDGKGFQIISDPANRITATQTNSNPSLGYNLYAAALKIIQENASLAIKKNDRKLLDKCFKEQVRVMQDKREAENINKLILEKFNHYNNASN